MVGWWVVSLVGGWGLGGADITTKKYGHFKTPRSMLPSRNTLESLLCRTHLGAVNGLALLLGRGAPKHKHHVFAFVAHCFHDCVRKLLPPLETRTTKKGCRRLEERRAGVQTQPRQNPTVALTPPRGLPLTWPACELAAPPSTVSTALRSSTPCAAHAPKWPPESTKSTRGSVGRVASRG